MVHGVASEGCSLAFRSGSIGTLAGAAAAIQTAHAATMRSLAAAPLPALCRKRASRICLLRSFRRAGRRPVLLRPTSPPECVGLRLRPAPMTAGAPAQFDPEAPAWVLSAAPCAAFSSTSPPGLRTRLPFFLLPAAVVQASRVTRTAMRLSTTSNSLHASRTSPAASGRSLPWLHWVSINCPGTSARRFRTRKLRTGTATSSSTGNRVTGALNSASSLASGTRGAVTKACFAVSSGTDN